MAAHHAMDCHQLSVMTSFPRVAELSDISSAVVSCITQLSNNEEQISFLHNNLY